MSSSPDDILVIKNGTLIDGTGGRSRPNRRIVRISRTALSGKTSRLRPRHVVSKPGQTHEPEGLVEVRECPPRSHRRACPFVNVPGCAAGDRLSDQRRILHSTRGPELDADPARGVHQRLGAWRQVVR